MKLVYPAEPRLSDFASSAAEHLTMCIIFIRPNELYLLLRQLDGISIYHDNNLSSRQMMRLISPDIGIMYGDVRVWAKPWCRQKCYGVLNNARALDMGK